MKKISYFSLIFVLLCGVLVGCESQNEAVSEGEVEVTESEKVEVEEPEEVEVEESEEEGEESADPVTITLWHSMSGTMGDTLITLADAYNASRTDYQIELQYQGSYSDALTKFKSTATEDLPDLYMCQAETTGYMISSGNGVAIQTFIDRDNFDISVLEPDLINYYTVDGQLMNLGFGRTIVGFIYNADMLAEAGYTDPYEQLKTWDDIIEAAETIVDLGLAEYGAALHPAGWMFEFYASTANKQIVDENNGRSGTPTKSIIDENGLGVEWFTFLKEWNDSYGTLTAYTASADYFSELGSGNLGMYQSTSSNISTVYAAADGNFEVGFLPLPSSSDEGGLTVGGNSTWIVNTGDDAGMEGAWDWIKYCLEFDSVMTWAVGTGYAPITTEVVESDEYKAYMDEICPTIFDGIDALRNCPAENEGALMSLFDIHRSLMWEEMQKIWSDPDYTPEEATANFVEAINLEFELYNATN